MHMNFIATHFLSSILKMIRFFLVSNFIHKPSYRQTAISHYKRFVRSVLGKFLQNRGSDRALGHRYAEIVCNCSTDHGKGIGLW